MTLQAVVGGAQASDRAVGGLAVGQQADLVELDAEHLALAGLSAPDMLSAHVFASHRTSAIRRVWAGGLERNTTLAPEFIAQAATEFVAARTQLLENA
jgi:formimidoylglutamate deiminase